MSEDVQNANRSTGIRKSATKEYKAWHGMKTRCKSKDIYVKKGISVCERWLNSFDNFLSDMGPAPSKKHSIDRKDNSGNYCPENCRWATPKEQQNNTDWNVIIEAFGEKKTLTQWGEIYGQDPGNISKRIFKQGWDVERAITFDAIQNRPNINALKLCGHADWMRCMYCREFSSKVDLVFPKHGQPYHRKCRNLYSRDWKRRKKAEHPQGVNPRLKYSKSGVIGVSWHSKIKRYVARIIVNKENKYLGCFKLLEDAAKARKEAEIKYCNKL